MVDKTVSIRLIGDASGFVAAVTAAGTATTTMGTQVAVGSTKASAAMTRLGIVAAKVGVITILGVAAGLALSAKAAIDFESSFAGVRKTVEATEVGFGVLSGRLRELATIIPVNINELNRIAELGGQLGVGARALPAFVETIAKIGVTTILSTEEAALGFARLSNIMQLSENDFGRIGSVIVELGNNFEATEDEILNFSLRIAPSAQVLGLVAGEVLAIGTAFSAVGVKAERGGTAVQKTLIALAEAAANGGDKLALFAEIADVTIETFSDMVAEDPAQAFESFVVGLGRVVDEGDNVFQMLRDLGLGNSRTIQSLLALGVSSGTLTDALNMQEDAWIKNNALTLEAAKRFDTTASKMALAKGKMRDLTITLGEGLLPVLGELAEGVGELATGFDALPASTKNLTGTVIGTIAGVGAASLAYKGLTKVIGINLVKAIGLAGAAAIGFKLVIGAALIAGVVFATRSLIDYGKEQVEAKVQIDKLTEAFLLEKQGIEGAARVRVSAMISASGQVGVLKRLGIATDEFVGAVLKEEAALLSVEEKMNAAKEANENYEDSINMEGRNALSGYVSLITASADEQEAYKQRVDDVAAANLLLIISNIRIVTAQKKANQLFEETARGGFLERMAGGYELTSFELDRVTEKQRSFNKAFGEFIPIVNRGEGFFDEARDSIRDYVKFLDEAFTETVRAILGQIDPWNKLGNAVVINVDKMVTAMMQQATIAVDFERLLSALNLSPLDEDLLRTFFVTLEDKLALVKLLMDDPDAFATLVEGVKTTTRFVVDEMFELFQIDIPALIKEGGPAIFDAFRSVVDALVEDHELDPAEAWKEVILKTLRDDEFGNDIRLQALIAIRAGLADIDPGGEGVGKDIIDGIILGIESRIGSLRLAMRMAAREAQQSFRHVNEMESPSKVYMRMGSDMMKGLEMGINRGMADLSGFGPQMLGIPNRHQLIAGSSTNTTNTTTNTFDLNVHGSRDTADDARAILLAAQIIGVS